MSFQKLEVNDQSAPLTSSTISKPLMWWLTSPTILVANFIHWLLSSVIGSVLHQFTLLVVIFMSFQKLEVNNQWSRIVEVNHQNLKTATNKEVGNQTGRSLPKMELGSQKLKITTKNKVGYQLWKLTTKTGKYLPKWKFRFASESSLSQVEDNYHRREAGNQKRNITTNCRSLLPEVEVTYQNLEIPTKVEVNNQRWKIITNTGR